jgi:hypothetical protein
MIVVIFQEHFNEFTSGYALEMQPVVSRASLKLHVLLDTYKPQF